MPWMAAAAAITGGLQIGASIFGASKQADAAKNAANAQLQAATQTNALQKYIYDQNRSDQAPYRGEGTNALYQIGDLLGVARSGGNALAAPGATGNALAGPSGGDAQTLGQIRERLQAWSQAKPGNAEPVIQAIDSGASLGQVQSMLQSLRATTTNPANTAYLDPALSLASNAANGYTVQPTVGYSSSDASPDNSPGGIAARQQNAFSTFRADPGYQFALDQGSRSLQNSAASRGVLNSGQTAKALTQFGQGLADEQYGKYFSRLQSLAGIGQTATNATQQAGNVFAAGSGQALTNAGDARASAYTGAANAWSNGLAGVNKAVGNGLNNYFYSQGRGPFTNGGGVPDLYSYGSGTGTPGSWSDFGYAN